MQEMLRSYVNQVGSDWDLHLSALEIAYNSSRHASTGFTPYELDIGFNPAVPIDIATRMVKSKDNQNVVEFFNEWATRWTKANDNVMRAKERQQRFVNKHRRDNEIKENDWVLLQINRGPQRRSIGPASKLGPRMEGPYRVKRVSGPVNVELELDDGDLRHPVVHISQLRKFIGNSMDSANASAHSSINQPAMQAHDNEHDNNIEDRNNQTSDPVHSHRTSLRNRKAPDRGPFLC